MSGNFKKYQFVFIFLMAVAGLFFYVSATQAHALDVSIINFLLPKCESGDCKFPPTISAECIISWPEAAFLINKKTGDNITDFEKLEDYHQVFADYFKSKIVLYGEEECDLSVGDMLEIDPETIIFDGVIFEVNFNCKKEEQSLKVESNLFLEYFDLQTNIIRVFNGFYDELLSESVLDKKETVATIKYHKQAVVEDIKTVDTFNEEAKSKNINAKELATTTIKDIVDSSADNKEVDVRSPGLSRTEKNSLLEKLTNKIKYSQNKNWFFTLLIVLLLGFLHTLEAGHSKTILASLLIDKQMNIRQGLGYALVFTITHVADILLLGILFLSANAFFDIYTLLPYLQIFSLYALLLIASYLLIKNTIHYFEHKFNHHHHHGHHHHVHEKETAGGFKHQLYIGFLAGLAPCLFGWSIFMLFLSTGRVWFVIPLTLVFGLGIFFLSKIISELYYY